MVEESLKRALGAEPGESRDFVLDRLSRLQRFYRELDQVVKKLLFIGPSKIFELTKIVLHL